VIIAAVSDARETVEQFIGSLDGETRQVAYAEWGLSVDAAGWPLHVGVAIRDGFVVSARHALEGGLDGLEIHAAHGFLLSSFLSPGTNQVPLIRFSHTSAGEAWIQGDLPLSAVNAPELDRFLGLLVLAATQAREHAAPAE